MSSKAAKPPRGKARRGVFRVSGLYLIAMLGIASLLYSVYGQRPHDTLQAGETSPQAFVAPADLTVVNQLATAREKQQARAQIEPVYSVNTELQRLVLSAIDNADLPQEVSGLLQAAYSLPEGIREADLPALIDRATELVPVSERAALARSLDELLLATAQEDAVLTEAARAAAAAAVSPVLQTVQTGETIVEEGQVLSAEDLRILEAAGLYRPRSEAVTTQLWLVAGCLLLGAILTLPLLYGYLRLRKRLSTEQLVFMVALALISLAAQRLALLVSPSFLFIAALPILMAVLVSEVAALLSSLWLGILIALLVPGSPQLALLAASVTTLSASLFAIRLHSRPALLLAGALGGLSAGLSFVIYQLLILGSPDNVSLLFSALWLTGGGIIAGILALGLLPLAESVFGFLTEFRLLELSSPMSPLLQRLLLEAPGTYQHSLIISNLVEQAVKNIGGNALLARVGSLYHDVGKLKRPQFFAENQFSGENPHDELSPHLSYLIITSHVRDGVSLLRDYHLPRVLESFVQEHHGTTVLSYFYKQALEANDTLHDLNFRYPGPRPRSKESAVLMLADAVESASRTLTEPSQGSIRALIDRLIDQRLQDDQLAESPLNFRDLEIIASTFERMLTAVLHRRIQYPSAEEIQGLKRGGADKRNTPVPLA